MPIYEYVCKQCGHEFELFVRSAVAATNSVCPKCGNQRIDKRFSTFASNASRSGGSSVAASSAPSCSGPV